MFTLRPNVSIGISDKKMGIPCLVEDPAYVLVRHDENPTPTFPELVQV